MAQWITCGDCESPLVKKEFTLPQVSGGEIRICGLGFFELYLNGRKVSEDLFVPAWSDYEPRKNRRLQYPLQDSFTHRVYYLKYDIGSYLHEGRNTIEVWLGNGWYNQYRRNVEGDLWYGKPKLWFEIDIADKEGRIHTIGSDTTALYTPGHITENNIYAGENQDFRLNGNRLWQSVQTAQPPAGELCLQTCSADKVIRKIKPRLVWKKENTAVYDTGENITGYAVFTQTGAPGSCTQIRYSEELSETGELDVSSTGNNPPQVDTFISDGSTNLCIPKFTWHGFRYFEITGNADDILVHVIHADVRLRAEFTSSDALLNRLFDAYVRSQLGNMHSGVVSDCPHRERLGYTGDGQLTADTAMLLFDCERFYEKWIQDILDCQDPETGHVQHTAPFYGGGGGPGGWGCAVVFVPYYHYLHYADKKILRRSYPHMVKWVRYMLSRSENGLVVREEPDGWCLGDWCTPDPVCIPEPFVNTYYFIKALDFMNRIAAVLGLEDDYSSFIQTAKQAMKKAFYCEADNTFCGGVQGADAFAIDIGLGNPAMLRTLAKKYDRERCFDTGIFGTDVLISVLCRNGCIDTAYHLLSATGKNTYGYLLEQDATTLWEDWDGSNSHNHHMFGAPVKHLFYSIMGVQVSEELIIQPAIPTDLEHAEAGLETRLGTVRLSFRRTEDGIEFKITPSASCKFIYQDTCFTLEAGIEQSFRL